MLHQNKFIKLTSYILILVFISFYSNAEDLISLKSGGKAVHWTSEKFPFVTQNIIDYKEESYWVSSGNTLPHVLTFALPINKRFEALSLISKNENEKGTWAKHIRVSSADPFPHMGGWEVIANIEMSEKGDEKIISIDSKRGRYFRLEIFSTLSETAKEASFSQFKVIDVYN